MKNQNGISLPDKIDLIDINDLRGYEKNARTHSDEQVSQIAASMKEFGWTVPILVDENNQIIAGHGRLLAAKKLGLEKVPTIQKANLSETQRRALVLADNKLALNAGWDEKLLSQELMDLKLVDFDLSVIGFSDEEIEELLIDPEQIPPGEEDSVPDALPEAKVVLGDIFNLGINRLMCGDSTLIDSVEKLMNGNESNFVFTDPPYGMSLDTDFSSMSGVSKGKRFLSSTNGGKIHRKVIGDNEDFKPELINIIFSVFPKSREVFLWGADYYADLIPNRNDGSWIVWDKRTNENSTNEQAESADKLIGSSFELCWSKSHHKRELARIRNGIFGVSNESGNKKTVHPTQKPVQLAEWFFDKWSDPHDLVVDLFGGSGSTMIACEKKKLKCFMMELDLHYCGVILDRWQKYSGKKAFHEDGRSWDEIRGS